MARKSLEEFTYLFIATCLIEKSRHLNLDLFKEYVYMNLSRNNYDIPKSFPLIDKKINLIITQMMEEGLVKDIAGFDYLIAINQSEAYSLFLKEHAIDMDEMIEIYNEYIHFAFHGEQEIYKIISKKTVNEKTKKLSK